MQSHLSTLFLFPVPFRFLLVYFSVAVMNAMTKSNRALEMVCFSSYSGLYRVCHYEKSDQELKPGTWSRDPGERLLAACLLAQVGF